MVKTIYYLYIKCILVIIFQTYVQQVTLKRNLRLLTIIKHEYLSSVYCHFKNNQTYFFIKIKIKKIDIKLHII